MSNDVQVPSGASKRRWRVKKLARQKGLSMDDLAKQSGVKYPTLQGVWQSRTQNPSYETLKAIAQTLGVTIEELEEPLDPATVSPAR
jgi:transcriptional regulator with XRE-family HTH domain